MISIILTISLAKNWDSAYVLYPCIEIIHLPWLFYFKQRIPTGFLEQKGLSTIQLQFFYLSIFDFHKNSISIEELLFFHELIDKHRLVWVTFCFSYDLLLQIFWYYWEVQTKYLIKYKRRRIGLTHLKIAVIKMLSKFFIFMKI